MPVSNIELRTSNIQRKAEKTALEKLREGFLKPGAEYRSYPVHFDQSDPAMPWGNSGGRW
jgi:hypothetical protein